MAGLGWGRPMLRGGFMSPPRFYGLLDKWKEAVQKDDQVKATQELLKKVTRKGEKKDG